MRSTGERIAEFAAGALTAHRLRHSLCAVDHRRAVFRGADPAGQDPLGDIQRQPLCDLVVERQRDLGALQHRDRCARFGGDRLGPGRAPRALHRMGRRDRPPLHRTHHLSALPPAADRHRPRLARFFGAARHQSRTAHHRRRPHGLRARRRLPPGADPAAGPAANRWSKPPSILAPAAGRPCAMS